VFDSISQEIDKNYFSNPVKTPMRYGSNFGELRSNHFHSGVDIKVARTGVPLYAPADGFVSRISVSAWGYGNALYISHPNGYTTVYGHLHNYSPKIKSIVRAKQYSNKTFALNWYPLPDLIFLKKGELIGYAGNSGHSFGAHLHFEVRNTLTEETMNPALFGFTIPDKVKPKFKKIGIYPLNENSRVNSQGKPQYFNVKLNGSNYYTVSGVIKVSGKVGFSFRALDYMSGVHNKTGIYNAKLKIDGKLVYEHKLKSFFFHESRAINSFIDYSYYKRYKVKLQKCFVDPGNMLRIYEKSHSGFFFIDNKKHKIEILIQDFYGNKSTLKFYVQSVKPASDDTTTHCERMISNSEGIFLIKDNFRASLPKGAVYNEFCFNFRDEKTSQSRFHSNIYHLHKNTEPLHKKGVISISAKTVPDTLKNKASIVYISNKGSISWMESKELDGFFTTKFKTFGKFAIMVDTVAPKIVPKYFSSTSKIGKKISFKISDNLSGIESFNGYIDDKWVLFQYDGKSRTIFYIFDDQVTRGKKHSLEIVIKDKKNNTAIFKSPFFK